jgi:beta-lactamase class A
MIILGRRYRHPQVTAIFLTVLLMFGIGLFFIKPVFSQRRIISPLPEASTKTPAFHIPFIGDRPSPTPQKDATTLLSEIKQLTASVSGAYSVYVYDLNTNQSFGYNETTIHTAASVIKVPILATLYTEAKNGHIDLDERITVQQSDIQDYGTGVIRYQGAGTVYSVKTLAQLMMEKSDNTAAFILTNLLTTQTVQDAINGWGLTQTDVTNDKTSNKDMAILITKMFRGEITNTANTAEMMGFMTNSDFENRLPKLLPKDVKVYHKIGNEIGNLHDIGIVEAPKHPYYIGVMTNDVTDEPTTEDTIANISKLVYDYMTR